MPEFESLGGGGGSSRSPKFKLTKKNIILYGGILVVLLIVLSKVFRGGQSEDSGYSVAGGKEPTNSPDMQANLDAMQGVFENQMNQFANEMFASQMQFENYYSGRFQEQELMYFNELNHLTREYEAYKGVDEQRANDLAKQISSLNKTNQSLVKQLTSTQKTVEKLTTAPKTTTTTTPKTSTTTTPKTTTTAPKTTTTTKTTTSTPSVVSKINNASYTGVSIVDYLKGAGVNSSMANREKIASQLGIKNYTGTASQNTKMLNMLKADDKKK